MKKEPPHASSPVDPRNVHYVLSTHWDREWYQPFQGFRHRLVRLLDRTLDAIAARELDGPFTTDGQAILLDDYLEIRPERIQQVRKFVRSGKIKVGPWFVLPDEWLVSGESIIRNLELGRATARAYDAEPSNAGFVCDLFGHVSQLPQIFAGFGIHSALVWRGLEPRPSAHLWWESPDGTRVLCYRFPRTAYCDYAWDVRRAMQRDSKFDAERADRDLEQSLTREAKRSAVPPLLVFDGGDHLEYDADYYRALMARRTRNDFPYKIVHSTLDDYLAEVRKHADKITDVFRGEMRETAKRPGVEDQQWLIPGVLSSRVPLKQANARCEMLLCHWAEPFGAIAHAFSGLAAPHGFLSVAWRWLLMNHPHDSICGCSVDAVHEDMKYRFAQCEQIADNVAQDSLLALAAGVEGTIGDKEIRVLVANPLAHALNEIVDVTLQIPAEWGTFNEFFGFEAKPGFRLYAPNGDEIPYQRIAQDMNRTKFRALPRHFPAVYRTNDVTIAIRLAIPALGYTTFTVKEGTMCAKDEIVPLTMLPTRHPTGLGLATSEGKMENALLAVQIEPNGTLTLTDKRTGAIYTKLLTFEDCADIGDGWYHGQAVNDQVMVSTGAAAEIALIANGPLLATFRVRTTMHLPAEFKFDRMVRSDEKTALVIDSRITLRQGADRLEVESTVHNTARDHRLRVLFPSGANATSYLADSAFDIVERPISLPADNHERRELAIETGPQQTWTAVSDATRGLAIVAPGLYETAVQDVNDRPIALTLLRATRRTVFTDGEPQGQLQGQLAFRFWIVPTQSTVNRSQLSHYGIQLGAGLRNFQLPANGPSGLFVPVSPNLPPQASFLAVTGEAVVTSARQRGNALELRCFNPHASEKVVTFDFSGRPKHVDMPESAERIDLEGNVRGERIAIETGKFSATLKAKEIVTFRLVSASAKS